MLNEEGFSSSLAVDPVEGKLTRVVWEGGSRSDSWWFRNLVNQVAA